MTNKTANVILPAMILSIVLGGLLGYFVPGFMLGIDFLGQLFFNALQVIIIPLIFASMVVGITALGDLRKVGRTGVSVVVYFLATTTIAVVIGLVLVNIINPGIGVSAATALSSGPVDIIGTQSLSDIISLLIPGNLFHSLANGEYLGLILFSLFFGGVLSTLGVRGRTVVAFFKGLHEVIIKLVVLIMYAAPVGLFSLVGSAVARNSDSLDQLVHGLGWLALTLVIGLIIQGVLVVPLIIKFFTHRSPLEYSRNMTPAFLTALGTSSSAATLPVTYDCTVVKNKVDQRASSFVLPMGATVNMDGTAMYVVIATIFIAQLNGWSLSLSQILVIGLTAILVSIGAAGIPSASIFMLATVMGAAGLPLQEASVGIALILAVDWALDRGRTVVNIWGDAAGAAVIAETFEFKTARRAPYRERVAGRSPRTHAAGTPERSRVSSRTGARSDRKSEPRGRPRQSQRPTDQRSKRDSVRDSNSSRTASRVSKPSPFEISRTETPALEVQKAEVTSQTGHGTEESTDRRHQAPRQSRSTRHRAPAPSRRTRTSESKRTSVMETTSKTDHLQPPRHPAKETTRQPDDHAADSGGQLSPETIAKELARVSEQLGRQENGFTEKPESATAETTGKTTEKVHPPAYSEKMGPAFPSAQTGANGDADETTTESSSKFEITEGVVAGSEDSKVGTEQATTESGSPGRDTDAESRETEFGRIRRRYGEKTKGSTSSDDDKKVPESASVDSFNKEDMSFGRGKKKRSR